MVTPKGRMNPQPSGMTVPDESFRVDPSHFPRPQEPDPWVPMMPFYGYQPEGSFSWMPQSWQSEVADVPTQEWTPYSGISRLISGQGSPWDVAEAALDTTDFLPSGGPVGDLLGLGAKGIGKVASAIPWSDVASFAGKAIPEGTVAGLAGVMPQRAKNLLKGTKVADTKGTPTRVYHGTQGIFDEFTTGFQDSGAMLGRGYYFTESPTIAGGYSETKGFQNPITGAYEGAPNIHATYLNLQKPLALGAGANEDVITKMSDEIFAFAKGSPTDVERADALHGFSQNLYSIGGDYGDPDDFLFDLNLDIHPDEIDDFIELRQWDKAEKGLLEWYKKASNGNDDVMHVVTDFFRTYQDPTGIWGKDVWTDGLQELGYDGITHIGKGGRGAGGKSHRVWIAFDEKSIFPFAELEGMKPELPPSGDFSKMLENIFKAGMGR